MSTSPGVSWQPSLLESAIEPSIDESFAPLKHVQLDPTSWVQHVPGWLEGSEQLFAELLETRDWGQRTRRIYDEKHVEPRLTASWRLASGEPLQPPVLERARVALSDRYDVTFDSVGFNLYRTGQDSVAWHGDHIPKSVVDPLVAILSVGEPRKFLLRPKLGGPSKSFLLGRGDLLITGGACQRAWQHSVPKVAKAGPRISITYRHGIENYD
ncbi:MAG: alpha-ketoglutarate-dependent dioxygenase AlkB [Actinomycetota bacterium]